MSRWQTRNDAQADGILGMVKRPEELVSSGGAAWPDARNYLLRAAAASSRYMSTATRPATVPPVNQPETPSFQVSPSMPIIRPIIPQISAPNAPNLPS